MIKEFLDCPNVVSVLEQMRCKGMTEGATAHTLYDAGLADGLFYGPLKDCLMHMVAPSSPVLVFFQRFS